MNGNLSGDLVLIVIGDSRTLIHSPKPAGGARVKKHRRHQRCFAHVAVAYNANVSDLLCAKDIHSAGPLLKISVECKLSAYNRAGGWRKAAENRCQVPFQQSVVGGPLSVTGA